MTAETCKHKYCHYPDVSCHLGNIDNCINVTNQSDEQNEATATVNEGQRLSWTGMAMGHVDLAYIAGKKKPTTIGIVGPANAGKTSLLAAWYLLVGKGLLSEAGHQFAGSHTLEGWETLAHGLRWTNARNPPKFPAHTTSRSGRTPGLLHLTLQKNTNAATDYLFTDAPGEWFNHWANNVDNKQASGAVWIANNADIFIIIADSSALAGADKGVARHDLQSLINRVATIRRDRPVALVWTKSDIEVAETMKNAIAKTLNLRIPNAKTFVINIVDGDNNLAKTTLFKLLDWTLNCHRTKTILQPTQATSQDPLFLVGSRSL